MGHLSSFLMNLKLIKDIYHAFLPFIRLPDPIVKCYDNSPPPHIDAFPFSRLPKYLISDECGLCNGGYINAY